MSTLRCCILPSCLLRRSPALRVTPALCPLPTARAVGGGVGGRPANTELRLCTSPPAGPRRAPRCPLRGPRRLPILPQEAPGGPRNASQRPPIGLPRDPEKPPKGASCPRPRHGTRHACSVTTPRARGGPHGSQEENYPGQGPASPKQLGNVATIWAGGMSEAITSSDSPHASGCA